MATGMALMNYGTRFTRREFVAALMASSLVPGSGAQSAGSCATALEPKQANTNTSASAAVSLSRLIARLREVGDPNEPGKGYERFAAGDSAWRLGGLTRVDGFLVDRAKQDIVLWGAADADKPALYTDDFLVALRAALGTYRQRDGDGWVRYQPGISLDFDPHVWNLIEAPYQNDAVYNLVCRSPMTVRVDGMPRNTRVAQKLVQADFKMKLVAHGVEKLAIRDPFPSNVDVTFAVARLEKKRRYGSTLVQTGRRYWFTPGRFDFQVSADQDFGFMSVAQILLRDEGQVVRNGKLVDSGVIDTAARAFTCAWTQRMDEVLNSASPWSDMRDIYRSFALAKVIVDCDAIGRSGIDASFLQHECQLPYVKLPDTMPGQTRFIKAEDGELRYSICGGVTLALDGILRTSPAHGAVERGVRALSTRRPASSDLRWS